MEVKQDQSRYNACIHYIVIRGKLTVANLSTQHASISPWKHDLMRHVTHREADSGTVIHRIFDVWHYEVLWTCPLTWLLWCTFDYVHPILYIIWHSTKLPNALHCTVPSKLSSCAQAHSRACSQVHSQLHYQPTWLYTSKYGLKTLSKYPPEYTLKYSPNCTRCHTPILLDYMLPSMLSRCSQVHSQARSPLHSPEPTHPQSHLTTCFHICFWVLDPETGWVAGARHQEADGRWWEAWGSRQVADGGGWNYDVGSYHCLKLICCLATMMRSHDASWSWCWQLQPSILQEM